MIKLGKQENVFRYLRVVEEEYLRVKAEIKQRDSGGTDMANIKDVARQAGVSISTVSRVINDSKSVSPSLRVMVEKAIDDLNYSTNSIARGLKSSQTNNIAVILTSVSRTFFSGVLEGINKEADQEKYSIFISETHDSIEREIKLVRSCASQWVDGIILASSAYGNDMKTRKYIESLSKLEKKGELDTGGDSGVSLFESRSGCGGRGSQEVRIPGGGLSDS